MKGRFSVRTGPLGDVYREIKAGAVFRAERGRKRSELVPGVYVDTPEGSRTSVQVIYHQISGYLGQNEVFDTAIASYAEAYADQVERDYATLVAAAKSGRVHVEKGI